MCKGVCIDMCVIKGRKSRYFFKWRQNIVDEINMHMKTVELDLLELEDCSLLCTSSSLLSNCSISILGFPYVTCYSFLLITCSNSLILASVHIGRIMASLTFFKSLVFVKFYILFSTGLIQLLWNRAYRNPDFHLGQALLFA